MELPAELEVAIRAAPDDRAAYRVAGDWLLAHGDPQGELIAAALAAEPDAARVRELEATLELGGGPRNWVHCDWRWGFVRSVRLYMCDNPHELSQLRTTLAAPAARFVRELVLDGFTNQAPMRVLREAIAARPHAFGCVTSLVLSGPRGLYPGERALSWLWPALPRLERLTLAVRHDAEPLSFPALRELALAGGAEDLAAILAPAWPMLETLRLTVEGRSEPVLPLLTRARFPALRRLAITATNWVDAALWRKGDGAALGLQRLEVAAHGGVRRFAIDDRTAGGPAALLAMGGRLQRAGTLTPVPDGAPFTIGDDPGSDLVLDTLVPCRAALRPGPTGWSIEDLDARGGVQVNGAAFAQAPLRRGDEIAFVGQVFRFLEGERLDSEVAVLRARFALP